MKLFMSVLLCFFIACEQEKVNPGVPHLEVGTAQDLSIGPSREPLNDYLVTEYWLDIPEDSQQVRLEVLHDNLDVVVYASPRDNLGTIIEGSHQVPCMLDASVARQWALLVCVDSPEAQAQVHLICHLVE